MDTYNLTRQVAPFEFPAGKYHCLNDDETTLDSALLPRVLWKKCGLLDTFAGQWFTCKAGQAYRAQFYFSPMVF